MTKPVSQTVRYTEAGVRVSRNIKVGNRWERNPLWKDAKSGREWRLIKRIAAR